MPELPEVETIRRQLEPMVLGRRIVHAGSFDNHRFRDALLADGGHITALSRRGKYLLFDLEQHDPSIPRQLIIHLGMTGRLSVESEWVESGSVESGSADDPHLRAWWTLDDPNTARSTLLFHDIRRFGRVSVVDSGDYESLPTLHSLGPEPLDGSFTPQHLTGAMSGRRPIKSVLLGQRAVAGVGNIYADEALWISGIRPSAKRLSEARAVLLHAAIVQVLEDGLADGGTTLKDYRNVLGEGGTHQHRLNVYGQAGSNCRRCGSVLRSARIDGRGTTWCSTCQH